MSQFVISEKQAFRKLETKQVRKVFRAFLAVNTYALKSDRNPDLFHFFCKRNFSVTFLVGAQIL